MLSPEDVDNGLIDLKEFPELEMDSSEPIICKLSSFLLKLQINDSNIVVSMLTNALGPEGLGEQADTNVAGIFESKKSDGKRNKTPGVRKLSKGVALRLGPNNFRLSWRLLSLSI